MTNTWKPLGEVARQLLTTKFPHGCRCAICSEGWVNLERYRGMLWCNDCIERVERAERYSGRETGFGR